MKKKNTQKCKKKEDNFVKKKSKNKMKKKWKEKHVKKVKAKFSTSSILKTNSTKIFFKKIWGNTVAKQKPCGETL